MKSIITLLMAAPMLLSMSTVNAQTKNVKTESFKVSGNCGMCKSTIEKAGNVKGVSSVTWDKETKLASIKYDSKKTTSDDVLKHIALAGYDNEHFFAPDEAYAKLSACCKYERQKESSPETSANLASVLPEQHNHTTVTMEQDKDQLKTVLDKYFDVKNALVKSDGKGTSSSATELISALNAVKMEILKVDQHTEWMKVKDALLIDAMHIAETNEVSHQRDHFVSLSDNMYKIVSVSKPEAPVYYQHCPMFNDGKGANWLSQESAIKNPYYGSQMLSCGKTVETIH